MNKLGRFALSMAKVGCIGFGGGSALIPVVEDEIIKQQKLDTKENYDKDVVVASITPGALPVEIAASLGKRNFGYPGMFIGALMMALPGAAAAVLFLTVLSSAQEGMMSYIEKASVGVSAFILFLLTSYITNVIKKCKQESNQRLYKAYFVIGAVFFLVCGKNLYKLLGIDAVPIFSVSTFHILMAAFFFILYTGGKYNISNVTVSLGLCMIYFLSHGKAEIIGNEYVTRITEVMMCILAFHGFLKCIRGGEHGKKINKRGIVKDLIVCILIFLVFSLPAVLLSVQAFPFLGKGLVSAIMSFGGGDAYLTVADGLFVSGDMITEKEFYSQIVPVVNILPGSILCKTLSGVGYFVGYDSTGSMAAGIVFAIAGFVCSVAFSCASFFTIYHLYDSLTTLRVFQMISRWIRPIISGLLINIMLSLCNQSLSAATGMGSTPGVVLLVMMGMYAALLILGKKTKINHVYLLLLSIVVPFLVL